MAYPQTITLNAGDKLLYTGSCALQISIVLPDGSTQPITTLSQGRFAEAPVTTDYELKLTGGTCCAPGDHVVYPAALVVGGEPTTPTIISDKVTYCNTDLNKQFIKTCVFTVEANGTVTETLLSDVNTGYDCGVVLPTYDIEKIDYCNPTTGTIWTKVCRYVTVDGVTTEELFSDTDTSKPCVEVCEPAMSEVFGETTDAVGFHSIAVINPKCCEVKVTTSAGVFTVMPNEGGLTEDFDCLVTLESVEVTGDCDPASVHTILTKRF